MGGVYNKDNRVVIYNADCLIMMDKMIKGGMQVDCIATDSPYLMTARGCNGTTGGMLKKKIGMSGKVVQHNACDVTEWMPKCYDLLKNGGACIFHD